jgi:uncharacterized protein DUF4145
MTQKTISKIRAFAPTPSGIVVPIVCPACQREGNFTVQGQDLQLQVPTTDRPNMVGYLYVGHRLCPNPQCFTHVFVVYENGQLVRTYPAGRIDFEPTDVPARVIKAFDEALTCTANECYIAAAMLIRKTLEAVCEDRGAAGGNLKERILDLQKKVTLPKELFAAMDHLRLLGNDAAHIEAKDYDNVGQDEVAAGIELSKEIIKATYQYKGLLGRLLALKKP